MLHSCSIAASALGARAPAQAAQALATGQAPASVPAQAPAQAIGANNPCPNYGGAIARMPITLQGCQYLRMPFASEEKGNKMEGVGGLPLEIVAYIGC